MSLSASLSQRLTSIRQTFSRRRKEREQEAQHHKTRNITSISAVKSVEDMYSKPNKFSLPVIPDTANPSLVIVTKKTMNMVRRQAEDDDRSYMSVHVQSAGRKDTLVTRKETKNPCCSYCDSQKLKKYSVMFLLVSSLVTLLTVGLYFMSDNVVTVSNKGMSTVNRRSFVYDSLDTRVNRASTWKDYNQVEKYIEVRCDKMIFILFKINWGTAPVRPLTTPSSFFPSPRGRSRSSAPSPASPVSAAWAGWSAWSECSRSPCIKGETIARSRRCEDTDTREDADMKICLGQGGVNVEMEPCFCF